MFSIRIETGFKAAHQLTLKDGSKELLHNHVWLVHTDVAAEQLNDIGLVMDFHLLKAMVDASAEKLENISLNEIDYFKKNNPSAENVAKYIFQKLEPKLPQRVKLYSVRVFEQSGCSAKFAK